MLGLTLLYHADGGVQLWHCDEVTGGGGLWADGGSGS